MTDQLAFSPSEVAERIGVHPQTVLRCDRISALDNVPRGCIVVVVMSRPLPLVA